MAKTDSVFMMMKDFLNNKTICSTAYAKQHGLSENTIRRHRKTIENLYPNSIVKVSKGCYKMLTDSLLVQSRTQVDTVADMGCVIDIAHIFNPGIFSIFDEESKKLINQLSSDTKTIYSIKQNPFEDLKKTCASSVLTLVKKAIVSRQYIDIHYQTDKTFVYKNVKVFKIVFAEQNWYLATVHKDDLNNGFKWLRLAFITDVQIQPRTFHADIQVSEHAQNFQTLFSLYREPTQKVTVYISKEVARFFTSKKHLSSQKIEQVNEDGSLHISYMYNTYREITPLIKKWIPHLKVLSPQHLQEKINKELKYYLTSQQ